MSGVGKKLVITQTRLRFFSSGLRVLSELKVAGSRHLVPFQNALVEWRSMRKRKVSEKFQKKTRGRLLKGPRLAVGLDLLLRKVECGCF